MQQSLLNCDRFSNRTQGCEEFLEIVEFLAKQHDGTFKARQNTEEERHTWYIDTPDLALQQQKFILRIREDKHEPQCRVMLKYRSSDRYLSALQPVSSPKQKSKFEEDITPPFISKFSKSCSAKFLQKPELKTVRDIVELFPGIKDLGIALQSPVKTVNGFTAHEVASKVGQIEFDDQKLVVNVRFSFWYLFDRADGFPLIGEFSFDYDTAGPYYQDSSNLNYNSTGNGFFGTSTCPNTLVYVTHDSRGLLVGSPSSLKNCAFTDHGPIRHLSFIDWYYGPVATREIEALRL